MTVRRLLHECDSRELTEWMALRRIDPWGQDREDLRAATICATTANVWRGKGQKAAVPGDFMPDFAKHGSKGQTPEQMKAVLMTMAGA